MSLSTPHYPHPALKDILEETYGVIVYQDQVLQIARTFAGYSLGQADIVRKAMGKKIPAIMVQEKENFINGAIKQNYSKDLAEQIFALIEPFAGYAFNKAHSVSYGLISYWTAYLKANYTAEYMVALLNTNRDNTEKVMASIAECQRLGIEVLPPDVNYSEPGFSIEDTRDGKQNIRFGLAGIKGIGESAVDPLVQSRREAGRFDTLEEMCKSADLGSMGKKSIESLIKVGAMDRFGDRTGLLEVADRIVALAQSESKIRNSQQTSMFDMMGDSMEETLTSIEIPATTTSDAERGLWEQELLGFSVSNNALLTRLKGRSGGPQVLSLKDLRRYRNNDRMTVAGILNDVSYRYTRDNKRFGIATLMLSDGNVEVFVWPEALESTEQLWQESSVLHIAGTVRIRDEETTVSCQDVRVVDLNESTPLKPFEGYDNKPSSRERNTRNGNAQRSNGRHQNGYQRTRGPQAEPATSVPPSAREQPVGEASRRIEHPPAEAPVRENVGEESTAPIDDTQDELEKVSNALTIFIRESDDEVYDKYMLNDIKDKLLDNQGDCQTILEIETSGQVVTLTWDALRSDGSDNLVGSLNDILGESGKARVSSAASA